MPAAFEKRQAFQTVDKVPGSYEPGLFLCYQQSNYLSLFLSRKNPLYQLES